MFRPTIMRFLATCVCLLAVSACSNSDSGTTNSVPETSDVATDVADAPAGSGAVESTVDSTAESETADSASDANARRAPCDSEGTALRVRSIGPIFSEEGSVDVLEIRADGELFCERRFVSTGIYNNNSRIFTSDLLEVLLPAGDYSIVVARYACGLTQSCDLASEGQPEVVLAELDRGQSCEVDVSITAGDEIDLVAEFSAGTCALGFRFVAPGGTDGPVVSADPALVGESALAVGTVELVDDCLLLGDASTDPAGWPAIVWQAGTRWDPEQLEVILPIGTRVAMGTKIEAGGGFHSGSDAANFISDPAAQRRAVDCAQVGSLDGLYIIQHPVE